MPRSPRRPADGRNPLHHIRVQRPPLVSLLRPHGPPTTIAIRSMPNSSVTSRCWLLTLSYSDTHGNRARSYGIGVFDGDDESPFPIMLGTMMKYRSGSSACPGPIIASLA